MTELQIGPIRRSKQSDADGMSLPVGSVCSDCVHFERTCEWLISCHPRNETCDWAPSRFRRKPEEAPT